MRFLSLIVGIVAIAVVTLSLAQEQQQQHADERLTVELAIFLDSFLWQKALKAYGSEKKAEQGLRDYATAIVSQAQATYHLPSMKPQVDLKVVHYELWKQQPELLCEKCISYNKALDRCDANKMLDALQTYQADGTWDSAMLLTGINDAHTDEFAVGGLSYSQGICYPQLRAALCTTSTSPADLPHELAHQLAMDHDPDEKLSNPSVEQKKRGFVWSAFRIQRFHELLATLDKDENNCLRTLDSKVEESLLDVHANPGKLYPIDAHCALTNVSTPKAYLPDQASWCSTYGVTCVAENDESIYQYAPISVYKTPCGEGKFCKLTMDWAEDSNLCVSSETSTVLDKFNFAYGNCVGHNIAKNARMSGISLEKCASLCDQNEECKAFLFNAGSCQLKSSHCNLKLTQAGDHKYQFFIKTF